jgi:hypothetical protein
MILIGLNYKEIDMSVLVRKPAPDFKAPAVLPSGEIVEDFKLPI